MKTLVLELDDTIYTQVIDFLRVLPKQQCHIIEQPHEKPITLGLFKGKIQMSEDFNEPLPDSFWLEGQL